MSDLDEHPASCGDLVGLLAEPDRRSAFAALVLGATTLPTIAEKSGLTASATAVALRKLVDGRIATEDRQRSSYTVIENAFREAVRMESRVAGDRSGNDGAGAYFRRGRITAIPGNADVRSRVLSVVADAFNPGETYPEAKVNALCAEWFDDWVSLRRALVDEGLLDRDMTGSSYVRR